MQEHWHNSCKSQIVKISQKFPWRRGKNRNKLGQKGKLASAA